MHMKSYLSQSWEWKLITTSALKRLQPFRSTMANPKVFCASRICHFNHLWPMHEDWGEEGCSKIRDAHHQFPQRCQLLCPRDLLVTLVVLSATKYRGSRGSPGPGLTEPGNWWWREALRADRGRNSLYCHVTALRKQIWSNLTLGSLQVVAVCPVAAEELRVVTILGMQCFFLQVPRVQQQKRRKNRRVGAVCPHLLISEQPSALQRKH